MFAPSNHMGHHGRVIKRQIKLRLVTKRDLTMDLSRCPQCKKRLIAMTDKTGRTNLACLKCDKIDPMKTEMMKWASSKLAQSAFANSSRKYPRADGT